MRSRSPMDVLRNLAQQKLEDTTRELGKAQQSYSQAASQQAQLENYQQEYLQQLRRQVESKGMLISDLVNQQSFIDSLGKVVSQHAAHLSTCQKSVDQTLASWRYDKQRLNAYDTLKNRSDAVRLMKENRLDQKNMDEFAQRASLKKGL